MAVDGHGETIRCPVCGEERPGREMIPGAVLNDAVAGEIGARASSWEDSDAVCAECLVDALSAISDRKLAEDEVDDSEARMSPLQELHHRRTFGERVSDTVASFVGSWTFLIAEGIFLGIWIAFNSVAVFVYRFDPYPFIFLNLVLSWAAALQAPLILMSQNRQDTRDRVRDEHEYGTNLAAEREVRQLQEKMDLLLTEHLPQLLALTQEQTALLERSVHLYPRVDDEAA